MRYVSGGVSLLLTLVTGVVFGFILLVALNGFSGRAADYALYFYALWVIGLASMLAIAGYFGAGYLERRSFNAILVVVIPVLTSAGISGLLNFLGVIIAGIIADNLWKK